MCVCVCVCVRSFKMKTRIFNFLKMIIFYLPCSLSFPKLFISIYLSIYLSKQTERDRQMDSYSERKHSVLHCLL